MRIVNRRGAMGGVERDLAVVNVEGQTRVYFSPVGATQVQLSGPHFVAQPGATYGDVAANVDALRNAFSEFVCPDFANHEELKALRAEYADLKRSQISKEELEALRADRAELGLCRAEERERAQIKARQAVLDTPRDKRSKGV